MKQESFAKEYEAIKEAMLQEELDAISEIKDN